MPLFIISQKSKNGAVMFRTAPLGIFSISGHLFRFCFGPTSFLSRRNLSTTSRTHFAFGLRFSLGRGIGFGCIDLGPSCLLCCFYLGQARCTKLLLTLGRLLYRRHFLISTQQFSQFNIQGVDLFFKFCRLIKLFRR